MDTPTLPPKEQVALAILQESDLYVHIDPRRAGVALPDHLMLRPVMLQVGLNMPVPIPDLRVDKAGIQGTLSFNRSPFLCQIPWDAIYALSGGDGKGMVWPESMPQELEAEVDRELGLRPPKGLRVLEGGAADEPAAKPQGNALDDLDDPALDDLPPPPARLRAVAEPVDDDKDLAGALDKEPKPAPESPGRGHLRLVK